MAEFFITSISQSPMDHGVQQIKQDEKYSYDNSSQSLRSFIWM